MFVSNFPVRLSAVTTPTVQLKARSTVHKNDAMSYYYIFYVQKRSDLSDEEFQKHYETIHMPLIKAATGNAFPKKHSRYYIKFSSSALCSSSGLGTTSAPCPMMIYGNPENVNYDCVVMLEFEDESGWLRYEEELATCKKSKEIAEDVLRFLDLGSPVAVAVGKSEYCSIE
jgi:hypothetical protein